MSLKTPTDDFDQANESPKITMPEDKRPNIAQKLGEYQGRLARYQAEPAQRSSGFRAPELYMVGSIPYRQIGTVYKIAIAKELLERGVVDTHDLSRRLSAEHGGFEVDRFNNACAVMQGYCEGRR